MKSNSKKKNPKIDTENWVIKKTRVLETNMVYEVFAEQSISLGQKVSH